MKIDCNKYAVTSNEVVHYYPFLAHFVFNKSVSKIGFCDRHFLQVLLSFVQEYLQKGIAEGSISSEGTSKMLYSLTETNSKACISDEALLSLEKRLNVNKTAVFEIPVLRMDWKIKRFGEMLAILPRDKVDATHKQAVVVLTQMSQSIDSSYIRKFVEKQIVTAPRGQGNKGNEIDVSLEIESLRRYLPDIVWVSDMSKHLASALKGDYIKNGLNNGSGVEIGKYHDMSVYLKLIYGSDKAKDRTWRQGAVSVKDGVLKTNVEHVRDCLFLQYSLKITDNSFVNSAADMSIDYDVEQIMQADLAKVMYEALSARHLAETNVSNPFYTKWRKKEKVEK